MMLPETTLKTRSDQIKTLCKKLRKIKVRSTLASMFLQDAKAENILVSFIATTYQQTIVWRNFKQLNLNQLYSPEL